MNLKLSALAGLFIGCLAQAQVNEVGVTSGSFSVSEAGSAHYTIPIAVPKGTSGMEPVLAVSYSSSAPNGSLGSGFSLRGLSMIRRQAANLAQDGFIDPVDFDGNDQFEMDGERLVLISGQHGKDGAEYRTERENFYKIIARGSSGDGPLWFEVWTKGGVRLELGRTGDSRMAGSSGVFAWGMSKMVDVNGNYLQATYENLSLECLPLEINYTGNQGAGLLPYNQVKFVYESRPDKRFGYKFGTKYSSTKRLKSIRTFTDSNLVRDYRITYETAPVSLISRIVNIQEFASDGTSLPPIVFDWSQNARGWQYSLAHMPPIFLSEDGVGDFGCRWADVNGDGLVDLIAKRNANQHITSASYLNRGNEPVAGTVIASERWIADNRWVPPTTFSNDDKGDLGRRLIDVNSDGRVDFVNYQNDSGTISKGVALNTRTGWQPINSVSPWIPPTWIATGAAGDFGRRFADLNGDGRMDMLWRRNTSAGAIQEGAYINTGDSANPWVGKIQWNPQIDLAADGYNDIGRVILDVNNDNLPDLLWGRRVDADTTQVGAKINNGNGWTYAAAWAPPKVLVQDGNGDMGRRFLDVNGDGLPDFLGHYDNPEKGIVQYFAYLNTGTGWIQADEWNPPTPLARAGHPDYGRRFIDVNGDGLPDLLAALNNSRKVWLNTGYGWQETTDWILPANISNTSSGDMQRGFEDLNGDGLLDFVYSRNKNGTPEQGAYLNKAGDDNLIVKITNSLGAVTTIKYRRLNDKSGANPYTGKPLYTRENQADYPIMDVQDERAVVANYGAEDGLGGVIRTHYSYGGLQTHARGRGSRGFRWIEAVNETTQFRIRTVYLQDFPFTGLVASSTKTSPNGRIVSVTQNMWETDKIVVGTRSYYFPYLSECIAEERDEDGNVLSNSRTYGNEYDEYGNLTASIIDSGDGHQKIINSTFENDPATWRLGRLTGTTVIHKAPGVPDVIKKSGFGYTGAGLLNRETAEPENTAASSTSYGFDRFGNITTTTVSATGSQSRVSEQIYDSRGRFIVGTVNALGHKTTAVYDERHGAPLSTKDANQHVTTYTYDGFGRLKSQNNPDGTISSVSYRWATAGAPAHARFGVTTQVSTSSKTLPPVTVWHDVLGREIGSESASPAADGRVVRKTQKFNIRGQRSEISIPYYDGDPIYWTTLEYDTLGRARFQKNPDGLITEWRYGHRFTETIRGNEYSKTIVNAVGQPVSVTDAHGKLVRYSYDALGQVTRTYAPDDSATQLEYDVYGRKTAMVDPNMGRWEYRYNPFGELVWQKDAKLQEFTFKYDVLGRLIEKADPEGTTTWTYDTAPNGIGQLHAVRHRDVSTYTYQYDSLSRPSVETRNILGVDYVHGRTYDVLGRLDVLNYPNGTAVKHHYNSSGSLYMVTNPSGLLAWWQAREFKANGAISKEQFANGLETTMTFHPQNGRLLGIETSGGIQKNSYTYDIRGNLTSRSDLLQNKTEQFTYDGVQRLASAGIQGQSTQYFYYNAAGNLTSKPGVGVYTYGENGAGPHALTSTNGVVTSSYAYDANGNMTSGAGRTFQYVSHNKPRHISKTGADITYLYGPNEERIVQYEASMLSNRMTIYAGGLYERVEPYGNNHDGTITERCYIVGGKGVAAILNKKVASSGVVTTETRYLHKDHLGSAEVITNEAGAVVERFSYDAWGKRRNADWSEPASGTTITSTTSPYGFTGHEMLDSVGLVHMGGRVYDPLLGRVTTADPLVQAPENGQSYNRYSYCFNNPLSLTDPSGYSALGDWWDDIVDKVHDIWDDIEDALEEAMEEVGDWVQDNPEVILTVAVVVTAVAAPYASAAIISVATSTTVTVQTMGVTGAILSGAIGGATMGGISAAVAGGSASDILKGMLIGAGAGALTAAIGSYVPAIMKPIAHGMVQGMSSEALGGDFESGFIGGAVGSLSGSIVNVIDGQTIEAVITRTVIAGILGGTAAELTGGKFANAAISAAFVHAFNGERENIAKLLKGGSIEARFYVRDGQLTLLDRERSMAMVVRMESGTGIYVNRPEFEHLKDLGPLPRGTYRILDRIENGSSLYKNTGFNGYMLIPVDNNPYDDYGVYDRGEFRLHFGQGIGCVVTADRNDFVRVQDFIQGATTSRQRGPWGMQSSFGSLNVKTTIYE